jgi:hypothetical protein
MPARRTSSDIGTWFDEYDNPNKEAMLRIRDIILEDERITESIKWKAPTFMYRGNMASFNPQAKKHVSLLFHTGASIPGDHPRLEGGGNTARYMTFASLDDVEAGADELRAVTRAWCDSR